LVDIISGFMLGMFSTSLEMTLALIPIVVMPFIVTGGSFQNKELGFPLISSVQS